MNNIIIRENFQEMLSERKNNLQRGICLCAKKGKGKTTTINYLHRYCKEHDICSIFINFEFFNFKRKQDFFDHFSNCLEEMFPKSFKKYKKLKKEIQNNSGNTVLKNVFVQGSSIEHIGSSIINSERTLDSVLMDRFSDDFKRLPKSFVIFFDNIEALDREMRDFIVSFFVLGNRNNKSFLVFSWENVCMINQLLALNSDIRLFNLPDIYKIDDWYTFCNEYCAGDQLSKEVVRRSYGIYKNNPTLMRVCLGGFVCGGESNERE